MTYDEIYETELLEMVETLHSTASILVESRGVNEDFTINEQRRCEIFRLAVVDTKFFK